MMPFPKPTPGVPAVILAPMEGVTDAPMRALQTEAGGFAFCVSEFLRICREELPNKVYLRHVPELAQGCVTPGGTPVQVQLLGGEPAVLALSALRAVQLGAPAIDLNFGCPAPTVNRNDGGATLLKYPHRIRRIVSEVRAALPRHIPLSAKLRLGWDDLESIHVNAEQAALGGADWITIHGRTRTAGYAPPIYWEPIGRVRERLAPLPVVANGDIRTMEDFIRCRDVTGCEHFMIGRGALVDPHLPLNIGYALGIRQEAPRTAFGNRPIHWQAVLTRFDGYVRHYPARENHSARRIKQWTGYASRFGVVPWFDRIKHLHTSSDILAELEKIEASA